MTLQESIQIQQRFAERIRPIVPAMISPPTNAIELFLESTYRSIQSFSSAYTLFSDIGAASNALSLAQQRITQLYSSINYTGIEAVISAIEQFQSNLIDTVSPLDGQPYQSLIDSLVITLNQVEPYLPPEDKEQCEAIIKPAIEEKSRPHLTLSDALAILSLLITIFFGIVASMPDEQTERIIAQNEIIIDQHNEIIRLQEEDKALLDTLNSLSNSINLLTDEVELLREELENSNDFFNSPSQTNVEDTQQQNCDTQD